MAPRYVYYAYLNQRKKYPAGKLRTIFADHWERYRAENKVRAIENENVLRMLACRTPLLGKHIYECPDCGETLEIPHTCKSRFCSVCGYVATENWINERFNILLDCYYHHVVVTLPSYFRWIVKQQRTLVLNVFAKLAAETISGWSDKRGYEQGMICFYHGFNKNLKFHPHYHILVSAGGLREDGSWKYTDEKIPGHILMPIFKAKFTAAIKELFKKGQLTTEGNLSRVLYQVSHQHDKHWQFFTERITREGLHTMLYCARYCKKTVISDVRIIDYDGKRVTFWDGKKEKVLDYAVDLFIKCVIQAIPEWNFRLIRYYGFYAPASKKKYAQAKKYWNTLKRHQERIDWRMRQTARNAGDPNYPKEQSLDPFICKKCKKEMLLKGIVYPEPKYKRTLENILIILNIEFNLKLPLNSS